ncbi:hypothetical protein F511_31214 [Dorcoceras hygrometricum]|uniref:Retrotransposon Copia-like N-terminal domain-containing protein n=1 Tax=Dorcoceras hygrometricum TaxID=472368 RepID=A0A2Z7BTI9_9LAMI|nr:hypothetical protein F511_31214 [Dorcoceras hygrometricum]
MSSLSHNVSNFITLKLNQNNYPLWREQALALAESQDLIGHLTGETSEPNIDDTATTQSSAATAKITSWKKLDRLLRGWIIGTLSEEALGLAIGQETSRSVWNALKEAYAQDSQEREFTLRQQLTYLCKDEDTTIGEHIRKFKSICDNLAAIGSPLTDKL